MAWGQSARSVMGFGSMSGISGQHLGRHIGCVERFFAKGTASKVGGVKLDGLTAFPVETIGMRSVGAADVITSREATK